MSQGMYRTGPPVPADIITYRHNFKLVYVKPAETYDKALDIAQQEYEELSSVPRHRIGFSVTSTFNGQRQPVRISESAWSSAVGRLLRGEVIDIIIRADPDGKHSPPPQYLEVPSLDSRPLESRSKARCNSGKPRPSKSNPGSRSTSPSPNEKEKSRRSWFS
ncbi:hypothetical protein CC1G_01966 [Coprinopsis cinerea okayama7|uniref:Uncharacterized protein n=1 Tax=Coprinopsis cinerea (strain Okayama-7 / 130 / ATCC MYA-4618 / FGSC 9003) TaxID=240176 RepID=A8N648_COPC7|nr:hypothetical protein CC1G_01966 [Coprinopsis cinerea okayama7\|eukprot:XP_001830330.1 hypothetical protein CC1G_01966 [Coprinopsis cinerea okayama7\